MQQGYPVGASAVHPVASPPGQVPPAGPAREDGAVQDALLPVILVVVALSAVIAVVALAGSGRVWDQVGRGGMSLRDGSDRPARGPAAGAGALRERDEGGRPMLEARNARPAARGQPPPARPARP